MNQIIEENINKIVKKIKEQKNKSINEAQTKEWLIKPFFAALDWDFSNPDEVIPEDDDMAGKRTDYSFYINKHPKLLIEAKPLNNNLDDNKMIMEKLNYCSNSGTQLLIITNGDLYRIYYSDLKGIGKEKLLREFCLSDNIDEEIIDMLSRQAFEKDLLLNYAKNISILTNIKNVLEKLFSESNKTIINLINEGLKDKIGFKFHDDEIKKALKNISIEINTISTEAIIEKPIINKPEVIVQQKGNNQTSTSKNIEFEYTIEDHFKNGKWDVSLALYNKFINFLKSNNLEFVSIPMKYYINLSKNEKSFCQIISRKNDLKISINLKIEDLSEHEVIKTRDVSNIGHWGNGNIEFKLTDTNDFELALGLLRKSYNKIK
jgi:predicted type IV restriction endonuclease/predicted transport protein